MGRLIFISYRRDDDPAAAARVRDSLARQFGTGEVFMDVENLLAGRRFDDELTKALTSCDVFIAVMGQHWLELLEQRTGERDYVREEISTALQRGIAVIPVRVGRDGQLAPLPRLEDLPPDIADVVHFQKRDVTHENFGRDIAVLVETIRTLRRGEHKEVLWSKFAVVSAVAMLLAIGLLAHQSGVLTWPLAKRDTRFAQKAAAPVDQQYEVANSLGDAGVNAKLDTAKRATVVASPLSPFRARLSVPVAVQRRGDGLDRIEKLESVKTAGFQLGSIDVDAARNSSFDLIITEGNVAVSKSSKQLISSGDVKKIHDGNNQDRLVLSYLTIGEADYRRNDYFDKSYLEQEAPDWLLGEKPNRVGKRFIRFCDEGWQRTLIGDEQGRSLYNDRDPSPLVKLVMDGFDGIYLMDADIYKYTQKQCPQGARGVAKFIKRIADAARKHNPRFLIVLDNNAELLEYPDAISSIDAIATGGAF